MALDQAPAPKKETREERIAKIQEQIDRLTKERERLKSDESA